MGSGCARLLVHRHFVRWARRPPRYQINGTKGTSQAASVNVVIKRKKSRIGLPRSFSCETLLLTRTCQLSACGSHRAPWRETPADVWRPTARILPNGGAPAEPQPWHTPAPAPLPSRSHESPGGRCGATARLARLCRPSALAPNDGGFASRRAEFRAHKGGRRGCVRKLT